MKRTRATLAVLSTKLSADELAKAIASTPSWSVEKGTPVSKGARTLRRYSCVAFESALDSDADPSAHIDELLARLAPAQDAIRRLAGSPMSSDSRGVPVRVTLNIESSHEMFGFDLSSAQLTAIGELGAHLGVELDFDLERPEESR
jgi:hypothetical protein